MAVDASMRKLQVPPKFMPYLEKHRIYELFHDLANELAIHQPEDPLTFLKLSLENKNTVRDKKLIFLLTPPYLDRIKLAHLISVKTGCCMLSRYVLCKDLYDTGCLAEQAVNAIMTPGKDGWILSDFPDTEDEAKGLISKGVLPTHVFLLLPDKEENDDKRIWKDTQSELLEFNKNILIWKELFKTSVKIVKIKDNDLDKLASSCARLTMKMPSRNAPKVFRLALIGPRGSRRRTVAKILQQKFSLVPVDMEMLISAARTMENDLGDQIRHLDENHFPYPRKIVVDLLKKRLSKQDCRERGYVLTNFPCSVEDFVLLDCIENPPNRVIFLEIEDSACQARLEDRVVDMNTGRLYSENKIKNDATLKSCTLRHPDDEPCKVAEEIKFYNRRVQAMLEYCGGTCCRVDARGPITGLVERVEAVLMGPSPAAKPRPGKMPPSGFRKQPQSEASVSTRLTYPVARTEVIPLIDSQEMLRRFRELKRGPQKQPYRVTLPAPWHAEETDPGEARDTDTSQDSSGWPGLIYESSEKDNFD